MKRPSILSFHCKKGAEQSLEVLPVRSESLLGQKSFNFALLTGAMGLVYVSKIPDRITHTVPSMGASVHIYIFTCMHMIKFNHVIQINKHARFMDGSWVCDISKLKHHQGWHLNLLVLGIPFFAFYKKGPGSLVIKVVITPTNPI